MSRLSVQDGALVGIELGIGHPQMGPALAAAGLIQPAQLDGLWAEGQLAQLGSFSAADPALLGELGVDKQKAIEAQVALSLERLFRRAEQVRFEEGPVEATLEPIDLGLLLGAPESPAPALSEAEAMRSARAQAEQADQIDRQEALRRAATVPPAPWMVEGVPQHEAASTVADASVPEPPTAVLSPSEVAAPREAIPASEVVPPEVEPAPELPVLEVGVGETEPTVSIWANQPETWALKSPAAPASLPESPVPPAAAAQPGPGEDDLWKIVSTSPSGEGPSSPFEAAVQRIDDQLGKLVGLGESPAGFSQPTRDTLEAIPVLEIEVEEGSEEVEDLAADPSDPSEPAKLRRQRLMRRAMENLGVFGPKPPVEPSPSPPAAPAQASPAATADEAKFAETIEKRHQELSGQNHFARLGLSPQATKDQVKAAFLNLAKVFHPDRLPPSLGHLAPKMTVIFEGIREAYDTLFDDAKRASYLETLNRPSGPKVNPKAEQEASDLFRKGEVFFKKRDFLAAETHFEQAHQKDPKAVYLAAKGWAIYMDPARKNDLLKARQMMLEALRQDPGCDRAHYQLGVIARVEGDIDRAERHFKDAIRANPKHLEANQELRLIEMRKKGPAKKGLFR